MLSDAFHLHSDMLFGGQCEQHAVDPMLACLHAMLFSCEINCNWLFACRHTTAEIMFTDGLLI